jgi:hypothetical protein
MGYTVEMATHGMTYIPSFMKIGTVIRIILKILLQQFESL